MRSESSGALRDVQLLWDPKSWQVWLLADNFLLGKSEGTGGSAWGEEMDASEMLFLTVPKRRDGGGGVGERERGEGGGAVNEIFGQSKNPKCRVNALENNHNYISKHTEHIVLRL